MDHIVFLDARTNELDQLLGRRRRMLIRGGAVRSVPHGHVMRGDVLYFVSGSGDNVVRARAVVRDVINSGLLTETDARALIDKHRDKLRLSPQEAQRWAGRRFLVLVEVTDVQAIRPFPIDATTHGSLADWLPVGDISSARR